MAKPRKHKVGKKASHRGRGKHKGTHVLPAHMLGKSLHKKGARKRC
jgi:hypothetical protein